MPTNGKGHTHNMMYGETYPFTCADINFTFYKTYTNNFITETDIMLNLSLIINSIRHSKQHKLTMKTKMVF